MNIFEKIIRKDADESVRLGNKLTDEGARERRLNTMAQLNPDGFRTPRKSPKTDANGMTRGQRKRKRRNEAMAKVSERRELKYHHSHARKMLEDAYEEFGLAA